MKNKLLFASIVLSIGILVPNRMSVYASENSAPDVTLDEVNVLDEVKEDLCGTFQEDKASLDTVSQSDLQTDAMNRYEEVPQIDNNVDPVCIFVPVSSGSVGTDVIAENSVDPSIVGENINNSTDSNNLPVTPQPESAETDSIETYSDTVSLPEAETPTTVSDEEGNRVDEELLIIDEEENEPAQSDSNPYSSSELPENEEKSSETIIVDGPGDNAILDDKTGVKIMNEPSTSTYSDEDHVCSENIESTSDTIDIVESDEADKTDTTEEDQLGYLEGYTGWIEADSNWYWYQDGVKLGLDGAGEEICDPETGAWYWLDATNGGARAADREITLPYTYNGQDSVPKTVRYDADGKMVKGWYENAEGKFYYNPVTGGMEKGNTTIEGIPCWFDEETGIAKTNTWQFIDGQAAYWYVDGKRQGYKPDDATYAGMELFDSLNNTWCWLDASKQGRRAIDTEVQIPYTYSGKDSTPKWVRYDSAGRMVYGWYADTNSTYYYDMITGARKQGKVLIDSIPCWFDETSGAGKTNTWEKVNGIDTYWYVDGKRQGYEPNNNTYVGTEIFDSATNGWYWLIGNAQGKKAVNTEIEIPYTYNGKDNTPKWVRYGSDGKMVKGWFTTNQNTYYYDLTTGARKQGKVTIDKVPCWFDETTGIGKNQAWEKINGVDTYWYVGGQRQGYDPNNSSFAGKEIYDPASKGWYWLDGTAQGRKTVNREVKIPYTYSGKDNTPKWVRYDASGKMVKGWYTTGQNVYYYDLTTGARKHGKVTIDQLPCWFDDSTGIGKNQVWEDNMYWYVGGKRQGYDPKNSSYRGTEIYDPSSRAWYWLENSAQGKKAVNKQVQIPYTINGKDNTPKWVRYDADGKMIKGWFNNAQGTYYYDLNTGARAAGTINWQGERVTFDTNTGTMTSAFTPKVFFAVIENGVKQDMNNNRILASLSAAQAYLESSYGNSGLTKLANNLFGIKGTYNGNSVTMNTTEYVNGKYITVPQAFRKYDTWAQSIADHSNLFRSYSRYSNLVGQNDYRKAATYVRKDGYATDPLYTVKLISIIKTFNLNQWDGTSSTSSYSASDKQVKVTASALNVRTTSSTSGAIIGSLSNSSIVMIDKIVGNWGRLADCNSGWICLDYVKYQ